MNRNIAHITYPDVIKLVERQVKFFEWKKDEAIKSGASSVQGLTFDLECLKLVERLLKRHRKNPQLNLNDLFDQVKSR